MSNLPVFKRMKWKFKWIPFLFLLLGAVIMFLPYLWAVSGSLAQDSRAIYNKEFFKSFHWENYLLVFESSNFLKYVWNSVFIAAAVVTGTVLSNSFIGFGLARYQCKSADILFFIAIATMFLPAIVMMIPGYIIWNQLGLVDTYIPLTIGAFFGSGFNTFLMRQAFKSITPQLYEAAIIDGASPPLIYWKIYMPLVKPTLAAIAVFTFIGSWNNFFGPLIYITDPNKYTLPIGLRFFESAHKGSQHLVMAASLITTLPTILIYAFAQKYFVTGITSAAIKG